MLELNYIIENSGDSNLESYHYSHGFLTVIMFLEDIDKKIQLVIETDNLSFNNFYLQQKHEMYKTCRLEIKKLVQELNVEHGFYVPSKNFNIFMKESRANYYLAFGKKITDFSYLLSFIGYGNYISCLVANFDSIKIQEL